MSASKRAVVAQPAGVKPAAQDDEAQGPGYLKQQPLDEGEPMNLPQENHGGEVRQILKGQQTQQTSPEVWQNVKRDHLAGDEVVEGGDNPQKRGHLQEPEARHADHG